jgi:CHAT domain-containing protein/tetratricopeptide (TPR) repeat protein
MEDMSQDVAPQEEALLAKLPSASPEWQREMGKKISAHILGLDADPLIAEETVAAVAPNLGKRKNKEIRIHWWPRLAWVSLGSALVISVVSFLWLKANGPDVNQLLAQAYTDHRTLEIRIPAAQYAPMRVERAKGSSNLDKPPSLLKAEALISEHLRKAPNEPAWLQAKARADLLDGNYESAVKVLQRALEAQPDSSQLLTDLGSAYFLRARDENHASDYGNAIEALSRALAKQPDDPVALFNRALIDERMSLYSQAVNDWEHYLHVDPQGDWSNEARANLQRVREKMAQREKRTSAPLLSPSEFSALIDANREIAVTAFDQHAERYLEAAIQSWLPQAYDRHTGSETKSIQARRALEYQARILKDRHDDPWLADFLGSQPFLNQKEALRFLLASDEALHSGRYGLSIELARKSVRGFQRSGNQAGLLRARFALMLAQTFAFKTNDCLRTATVTLPLLFTTHYHWLQTQVLIQRGVCQYVVPEVDQALQSTLRGVELAKRFKYPDLELRARAFVAFCQRDIGSADRGLNDLFDGLERFWQTDVTNTRGENLYSVLFNMADRWHHLEALTIAEKINDFPLKDPVDQAINWELLAGAEERAGDYKAAQATLRRAVAQIAHLPEDRGVMLRRTEISLENARIQLHLGDPKGVLETLGSLSQQFEAADGLSQAEYFRTYGEAYLALGLDLRAEPLLDRALFIAETGLRSLRSETDKLQWGRTQGQIYRDLLEIKLRSGTSAEALALWEWYKGTSIHYAKTENHALLNPATSSFAPPGTSGYTLSQDTTLISYALLRNATTAFVFRNGNVQNHLLHLPSASKLRVLGFLNLCADPSADFQTFETESRRLYDVLIAPLESDIQGATVLRFETDGVLDHIPFDLLRGPDGRYLGDRFKVTYSPGLAYGAHSRRESVTPASAALIVVVSEAQERSLPPLPDAIDEGHDVATYFHENKLLSGSHATHTEILRSLHNATVFHFTGHAVTEVSRVGLLLSSESVLSSNDLVKLRPRHLQLVVLSACDTADGEDGAFSDVNSIARTFAVAGVPQIVASRWNVDSTVTRQLMREFYSNLLSGKTTADSLRAATATIRRLPEYQHPYYWGSFAVFGN